MNNWSRFVDWSWLEDDRGWAVNWSWLVHDRCWLIHWSWLVFDDWGWLVLNWDWLVFNWDWLVFDWYWPVFDWDWLVDNWDGLVDNWGWLVSWGRDRFVHWSWLVNDRSWLVGWDRCRLVSLGWDVSIVVSLTLIADISDEARVTVNTVGNVLNASIGKLDTVFTVGGVSISSLVLVEVLWLIAINVVDSILIGVDWGGIGVVIRWGVLVVSHGGSKEGKDSDCGL